MQQALKQILEIQELDMQMIRLMRLKKERQDELGKIQGIKNNLKDQLTLKESELTDIKKTVRLSESEVQDAIAKVKKLETMQNAVKKVEEFNALTQEMSQAEREKVAKEAKLSDLYDKKLAEEEMHKTIAESLESTEENSKAMEAEIHEAIQRINAEGRVIKVERDGLVGKADEDVFKIYERLLRNKKDRVIVPIENRCCSGCHIMLTAQDENLVRKGERLVFCEHCSRIHYWPEGEVEETTTVGTKPRRRRPAKAKT